MLIYVFSDSAGETAIRVVDAVISQFQIEEPLIRRHPFVRDKTAIDQLFFAFQGEMEEHDNGVIVFTFVDSDMRDYTIEKGEELNIHTMDILGSFMKQMSDILRLNPIMKPGLNHQVDEAYYKRVAAMEFTIRCDDGNNLAELNEADVVLVGISRTSKTPLCLYLAYQSIKAANIPIVPETPIPEALFKFPRFKVIGLTIQPEVLQSIRLNRVRELGLDNLQQYCSMERIISELEYSRGIMKKLGCPVIDTSNKAMEETAGRIMQIMQRSVKR